MTDITTLKATEKILIDAGFRQAYTPPQDDVPVIHKHQSKLAKLKKRQRVKPRAVHVRKVQPSTAGMTEVDLLRALQEHGIGRPATYAGIVAALLNRDYVTQGEGGVLQVTKRGAQVYAFLSAEYPQIFSLEFTTQMEQELDAIARGQRSYQSVLSTFWEQIQQA